jgi:hypothetical protein
MVLHGVYDALVPLTICRARGDIQMFQMSFSRLFLFLCCGRCLIIALATTAYAGVTILRPTQYNGNYANPPGAMDGNANTASLGHTTAGSTCNYRFEYWYGFPSGTGTTPKKLKITSTVTNNVKEIPPPTVYLWFSLDSGTTWPIVYETEASQTKTTNSITLPDTQDITRVEVYAQVDCADPELIPQGPYQYIWDIWIEEGTP